MSDEIIQLHDLRFQPFLSPETISVRVKEMAAELEETYQGKTPIFLAVLNGSFVFAADLAREYKGDCHWSFVKMASYSGMNSSGKVKHLVGVNEDLEGKTVIILNSSSVSVSSVVASASSSASCPSRN